MTAAALPGHPEIISFAARTYQGALSEPERADLAVLVMLLGLGLRSIAAIQADDPACGDEFAVLLWGLAQDLLASTLAGAAR